MAGNKATPSIKNKKLLKHLLNHGIGSLFKVS